MAEFDLRSFILQHIKGHAVIHCIFFHIFTETFSSSFFRPKTFFMAVFFSIFDIFFAYPIFSLLLEPKYRLFAFLLCPLALFLLDNRLEVYLWQRGQPEQTESSALAWSRWHNERRCAMQTALQYCKGRRRLLVWK